jgi:hypothetical protein
VVQTKTKKDPNPPVVKDTSSKNMKKHGKKCDLNTIR